MDATSAQAFYERYWRFRVERGDHTAANRIKLRHEQAAGFLRSRFGDGAGRRVIDLGCGDGLLGQVLAQDRFEISGTDISPVALGLAEQHYAQTRRLDLDTDPTPDGWVGAFDGVVCLEVLEHIETPKPNVQRCADLCRAGGVVAFSFPNIFSWKNRLAFLRGRWPGGYATFDPREHLQVFELDVFRGWVREAGLRPVGLEITPDLPRWRLARRAMFGLRRGLARWAPTLWAMQINVYAEKPASEG